MERLVKYWVSRIFGTRRGTCGRNRIVIPGEVRHSEIVIQTREGWEIPNSQSFETTLWDEGQLQDHRRRHAHAVFRTGAIPVYNCHGLIFAARRTAVWQTPAIRKVIADDRYERVNRNEVHPGDVILYVSAEDGDIEHSGIIIEPPSEPLFVPKVWSKWGRGAEVIHWANACPYDFSQAQYYRIRS